MGIVFDMVVLALGSLLINTSSGLVRWVASSASGWPADVGVKRLFTNAHGHTDMSVKSLDRGYREDG